MIRGIYAAASGMVAEDIRNDAISNNLANANTAGYKKNIAVNKDFRSMLISRIHDKPSDPSIGSTGAGTVVDEIVTIQSAGIMRQTGNPLDVAIEGKGFFAVETPNGIRYTRNGSFSRNAQGELVTFDGYRVLGENGPIRLGKAATVTIGEDGRVLVQVSGRAESEAGKLRIVSFADEKQLTQEGSSLFAASQAGGNAAGNVLVHQGMLELSNVNVVSEMVNLISGYRSYEINSKMVQAEDQILDKAVNEVGRI
ncbi:MAG: flgG 2 [Firmicutes bacterium]|nr:flgG 2 [Bacillota bacterium]